MRNATVKVYKAEELTGKAAERALEHFAQSWDSNDSDAVTEMFKQMLEDAGLSALDPRWSLSYCQGDGVAFYGKVDLKELVSKQPTLQAWHVTAKLLGHSLEEFDIDINSISSQTHHWNTMRTCVIAPDGLEDRGDEFCKAIDALCVDLSREMEKAGYEEIEYRTSMEQFLESADANEWEFTEDGEMF